MKRFGVLIIIFILLIGQGLQFVLSASETSQKDLKNFHIEVDESATTEKTVIHVKPTNKEMEGMQLSLPKNTQFSESSTNELNEHDVDIKYEGATHSLDVTWGENYPNGRLDFVLTDLLDETNILSINGITEADTTEIEKYNFTVEKEEIEEVAKVKEEVKVVEEEIVEEPKQKEESTTKKETQEKKSAEVQLTEESKEISYKATQSSMAHPNLEFYFKSLSEEIESGKTANFELNVKVTGSQTTYTNGEIVVNLPKHPEIPVIYPQISDGVPKDSLTIAGVSPVYDEVAGTLTYSFNKLKSGQVYKTIIEAEPELGRTPASDKENNIRFLEADASIKVDEIAEAIQSKIESTMVISNGVVSISKAYTQTIKNGQESNDPAVQGDYGIWRVKASIPKKGAGLTYIKENSEIEVIDKLPRGLIFYANQQEPGFNGVYNPTNHTITWKFDAPTFSEQEATNENLFEKELSVKLLFDRSIKNYEKIKNEATINYQLHGDVTKQNSATAEIQIASVDGSVPVVTGDYIYPTHFGAMNGIGNVHSLVTNGETPTVSDNAKLYFITQADIKVDDLNNSISPLWEYYWDGRRWVGPIYDSIRHGYKEYAIEYTIDEKLDLQSIYILKPVYRPSIQAPAVPLNKLPKTSIEFKINGQWTSEYVIDQYNTHINVEEFDLNGHIEAYKVSYRDTIGGFESEVGSSFNIYEGALGLATNSVKYHIELGNGRKYVVTPKDDQSSLGDRHVLIAKNPDLPPPTIRTGIQFVEGGDQPFSEGSNIQRGNNRIQIELQNDASSQSNVDGPMELVALLPKGVNILEQPNITFSDNSAMPAYEIIGEVNGQQQIKFSWENRRLLPREKLTASFDVDVTRTAPRNLVMEVFGFVGNDKIKVPASTGDSFTNSVLQTDENDINDNGNTIEKRVRSANKYSIVKNDNLQITKEVKGSKDEEFSLFGHTTPDGEVTYRFNLTNTTNEVIEQFTFLDVLPSVGDLGITDNKERESKFEVTLKGPISFVGTKWEDQVTVYYSKSKNPKRDDLYETVDFPNGSAPHPNPEGAENPAWKVAADVSDWDSIHSFMIVMKEGVEWLEGQDIEFEVAAKAPALPVDRALFDKDTPEADRAAWNSYAVTTNGLLAVEPLRVGVVMEFDIEDPEVEKTVNDQKETVELLNRDELFTWKVDYNFGNYTTDWESVQLSDQIHELLDIESIKVVDQDGNDVTQNGELTTVDNLVKFEVNKQDDSFAYLAEQTYTLIIESKIKDSATDEQLKPFIEGNGIPNEGLLTIDDDPKISNKVFVKPPSLGSLTIIKLDGTNQEKLKGAEFTLYKCLNKDTPYKDCELIKSEITGEDGKLLFDELELGHYKLVETKAPEGYRLLKKPLDVEITAEHLEVELEVENSKSNWELPSSGGIGTTVFYAFGILLMGLVVLVTLRRNKVQV